MRRVTVRAVLIVLSAALVAACASNPTYAPSASYKPPPPIQPKYSIQSQAAPPAAAPPATSSAPVSATIATAPPAAAVESAPLPPPVSTATETSGQPPQAQAAAPIPPPAQPEPEYTAPSQPTRRAVVREEPGRLTAGGKVVAASGMFRDYEVQRHDHVDAIARDLGTTRKVIVEANHLKAPYNLQPGQHLKVPVEKAYVAQSGDTVAQIAKRFDLKPGELASLNDLSEHSRLRAGERLALPAPFHDRGPSRSKPTYVTEYVQEAPSPAQYHAAPAQVRPSASVSQPPAARPTTQAYVAPRPSPAPTQTYSPPPARPTVQAYAPPRPSYTPSPNSPGSEAAEISSADVATLARGRFIWPVRGEIISPFGIKGLGRRNDGVDIRARQGTVIQAAASGNVVYAGDQVPGFGNLVLVKHSDGWVTAYAHLDKISVQMRQNVAQGQEIGQVGETGGATEPELHFEVRYAATPTDRAKPVDPMVVLPR